MELKKDTISTDLGRWLEMYMMVLENKNHKKSSLDSYSRVLKVFIDFSKEYDNILEINQIDTLFINLFIKHLKEDRKLQASSIAYYLKVIKSFFLFITENNIDLHDFTRIFKKIQIKVPTKEINGLSESEVRIVLNHLEFLKNRYPISGSIKSLIFKTLIYTGLRASELLSLKSSDLENYDENYYKISVKTKGEHEKVVFLKKEVIDDELNELKQYFNSDFPLASTLKGTPIKRENLYTMLTTLYKNAGINKKGVHILRHTFAEMLVEKNVNLETIRSLLGHTNITTTARFYAKTTSKGKIDALERLSEI